MSIQPVTTGNLPEIRHSQMRMEANLRTTTSGVSSVASSIAPASTTSAPAASNGFCATISAWISGVIEGIRHCLAKIPLIGTCFETGGANSASSSTTATDPRAAADALLINTIKSIFKQTPAATSGATTAPVAPAVPGVDLVTLAMDQFNAIETDFGKWGALAVILNADNSTDVIAKMFYDALPADKQDAFRGEMYRANGGSTYGGHDHREGFGDFMVHHQIRSDLAKIAALQLRNAA